MKIAVEGCCHGELDAIYSHIAALEEENNYKVDLLLMCGDFQAIRNLRDLQCMAVPDKYKQLGGFHKYYLGEKKAPMLTIMIGGNHEASSYLWELYHGGWVAPNIYFLGHAGCVQVNGIRIAGASGIFKPQDFRLGHWERLPYSPGTMRSIYHIREYCVRKLSLLSQPAIFLSHDWPQSIEQHGNTRDLLRRKPHFREDVNKGVLGSPPLMGLLRTLKPDWWFSAHLHCRFEASFVHDELQRSDDASNTRGDNPDEIAIEEDAGDRAGQTGDAVPEAPRVEGGQPVEDFAESVGRTQAGPVNPDEIMLDDEVETVASPPPPPPLPRAPSSNQHQRRTRFVALDKCLPRRQFLEVIDVPEPPEFRENSARALSFDPEWLAITRAFHPYMSTGRHQVAYPDEADARAAVERERAWVEEHVMATAVDEVQRFETVAPGPGGEGDGLKQQPPYYPNPQTEAFCAMLGIENKVDSR